MKTAFLFIFTLFITINFFGQTKPTPSYSMNGANLKNSYGEAPFTVNFADTSNGNGSAIVNWQWDFGDGYTSSTETTSHTYNSAGRYEVALTVQNGFAADSIVNFVNVLPLRPEGKAIQIYAGNAKTLADLTVSGTAIKWYDALTGGNLLPTSTVLVDNTTYYASQTINSIESTSRLEVTAKRISEATQTFERNSFPTVNDLQSTPSIGATVAWFTTSSSTTALANSTLLSTQTYFVEQESSGIPSNKTNRIAITVNVYGGPIFPTGNPTQIFVGDDKTLAELNVVGNNIKWYDATNNGNLLPNTTLLTDNTTYYASQTVAGVESQFRLAITAKRISDAVQVLAPGNTVATLTVDQSTNNTVKWYTTASGGTALENSDILTTGTYYVEQTAPTTVSTLISVTLPFSIPIEIQADGQLLFATGTDLKIANPDGSNIRILSTLDATSVTVQSDGKILIIEDRRDVFRMDADGANPVKLADLPAVQFDVLELSDGRILLTSTTNGLTRIDADGSNQIQPIPTRVIDRSRGLVLEDDGRILVAANNGRIKRLDASATVDIEDLELTNSPSGLAIGPSGLLYVTDETDKVIKRFDETTNELITVTDNTTIGRPLGLAIDANGAIIVYDDDTESIKKVVESYTSNRVAVTVNLVPLHPTGNPTQIFAGDDKTLAELNVVGDNIKWYDATSNGNLLPNTTVLTDNTTYYASQTVAGVESQFRFAVTVKRISSAKQALINGNTVADLIANQSAGNTVKWYTTPSGGTALTGTETLATGTYYIEQVAPTTTTTIASGFNEPIGVAIQKDGQILVADSKNNALKILNPDGTNIRVLKTLTTPYAVAVEPDGKILVSSANGVHRMDADGTNLVSLTSPITVSSIAVEADGKILLATGGAGAGLKRMNANGSNIVRVREDRISNVNGVAVDSDGTILVTDFDRDELRKLDANDNIISNIDGFTFPEGVAIGPNGSYYVVGRFESLVKKVNPLSENVSNLTSAIDDPIYIAINHNGEIFVTDLEDNTLHKIVESYTSNRVAVEVAKINRPTAVRNQIFVGDDKTIADLTATGTNIKWYAAAIGGTVLPTSTLLTDNATYYASQTLDGAESSTRFAVTVKRVSDAIQIKPNGTVADLVTTSTTGYTANWFTAVSVGSVLNNTTALTEGNYYVEQTKPTTATSLGSGFGGVRGIEVQADGKILVVDGNNRDIKRMNADGSGLTTLVSTGLSNPFGIAVLLDGKIIVTDLSGDEIVRYDADGSNKTVLGSGFDGPSDVAVQDDGKIVIADRSNNAIKRMDADGTNIVTLGSGFSSPWGVAIQADGKILIAESSGTSIKRMDADGSNIVSLGSGFSSPRYLVQELDGNILIADTGNDVVKRMSADGNSITTVTNTSLIADTFGVALEADGNFLVSNALTSATNIKRIIEAETSNRVAVEVSFVNTWLGTTDNTWYTASNWAGGVPTLNVNTVIPAGTPNNPMINLGLNEMTNLTIDVGATLQIETTGTLTIKGDVTQNGTITIRSDATDNGSLILEGNYLGSGNVVYQRYVTTSTNPTDAEGWHFVSSPVNGQNISDFKNDVLRSGVKYAIAPYDNSLATNRYTYYTDNTGTNDIDAAGSFIKGKGYSVKRTTAGTINFSGTPNTELVPITITDNSGGVGNKWNLIGNPFTAAIALNNDANATHNFLLANSTKLAPERVAVYQWNASTASYDIYNQATGSAKYVAAGQGFFLQSVDGGATINFTREMQEHQTGNIFSKSANTVPKIKLIITDDTLTKKTIIKYIDETTKGLDVGYDAGTFSANANSFDIYTHLITDSKGANFGVQCLPNQDFESMIIPVGLNVDANKNITISAEPLNLPIGVEVYLEDKENSTFTNLANDNHNFIATTALNGIGRFYLHTSSKALSTEDNFTSNNISMYQTSKANLRIVGIHNGTSKVILSDVLGKQVFTTSFKAKGLNDISLPNLKTGIYLVHLKTNQKTISKKIIIN